MQPNTKIKADVVEREYELLGVAGYPGAEGLKASNYDMDSIRLWFSTWV